MDTVTYPEARVAEYVSSHFVPCKVNSKEAADLAKKFRAVWRPTILCVDQDEVTHHQLVGFLPPDDYLPELQLARAKAAFNAEKYGEAARLHRELVQDWPQSPQAPEAQYWYGVSEYRKTGTADPLKAAWEELGKKYPGSYWTKKVPFLN